MKKTVISMLILLIAFFAFADSNNFDLLGSTTSEITAFKALGTSSEISGETYVNLALYQGSEGSTTVYDGKDISISARNTAYTAFNWVLTGNAYKLVSLSFSFSPMTMTSDSTKYIPYSVSLTKNDTMVGTVTANNSNTTRTQYSIDNTTRYVLYKDTITVPNTVNITTATGVGTVSYNMSTATKVYKDNNTSHTGNYYIVSYSGAVCSEWIRTGQASITLKITDNGSSVQYVNGNTVLDNGKYVANVVVTITAGT